MVPDLLQIPNLLETFYTFHGGFKLNSQEEALMSLVQLDLENTKPETIVYLVDNCIEPGTLPFLAIQGIITQLLAFFLAPVCDGIHVHIEPGRISYSPININHSAIARLASLN